jgi:hypothetical protein
MIASLITNFKTVKHPVSGQFLRASTDFFLHPDAKNKTELRDVIQIIQAENSAVGNNSERCFGTSQDSLFGKRWGNGVVRPGTHTNNSVAEMSGISGLTTANDSSTSNASANSTDGSGNTDGEGGISGNSDIADLLKKLKDQERTSARSWRGGAGGRRSFWGQGLDNASVEANEINRADCEAWENSATRYLSLKRQKNSSVKADYELFQAEKLMNFLIEATSKAKVKACHQKSSGGGGRTGGRKTSSAKKLQYVTGGAALNQKKKINRHFLERLLIRCRQDDILVSPGIFSDCQRNVWMRDGREIWGGLGAGYFGGTSPSALEEKELLKSTKAETKGKNRKNMKKDGSEISLKEISPEFHRPFAHLGVGELERLQDEKRRLNALLQEKMLSDVLTESGAKPLLFLGHRIDDIFVNRKLVKEEAGNR